MRGFQSGRLELSVLGEKETVEEGESASMSEEAASVAGIYAALRDDILMGTRTAPDFALAVKLARLIEEVVNSSESGMRRTLDSGA